MQRTCSLQWEVGKVSYKKFLSENMKERNDLRNLRLHNIKMELEEVSCEILDIMQLVGYC